MMHAKKSLGQNFLKSKKIVSDIVRVSEITEADTVLEIGPGKGVLTESLLTKAGRVVAIEKDTRMIPILAEKFQKEISEGRFVLVCDDIINLDLEKIFSPIKSVGLADLKFKNGNYKVVANIPYYITGQIIEQFLTSNIQPSLMTLLVQKEVALRITAKDKKESILSLSVKVFGEPKYIQTVQSRYFSPEPKVDSAVITIKNISKNNFSEVGEKEFFEVIKLAFGKKRKMVIGNLSEKFNRTEIEAIFEKLNINKKSRAEDIGLAEWILITKSIIEN